MGGAARRRRLLSAPEVHRTLEAHWQSLGHHHSLPRIGCAIPSLGDLDEALLNQLDRSGHGVRVDLHAWQ